MFIYGMNGKFVLFLRFICEFVDDVDFFGLKFGIKGIDVF